jgi:hypothetical protein
MAFLANWRTTMGKRHKPEEIIAKLRQVEVMTGQGTSMADAIRSIGVTEVTYYSMDGSPVASRLRADPQQAPLQTSIRRHPMEPGRPNGEAARAHLYSW